MKQTRIFERYLAKIDFIITHNNFGNPFFHYVLVKLSTVGADLVQPLGDCG